MSAAPSRADLHGVSTQAQLAAALAVSLALALDLAMAPALALAVCARVSLRGCVHNGTAVECCVPWPQSEKIAKFQKKYTAFNPRHPHSSEGCTCGCHC
ncbi:unnamed protein product [Ectocarpus sp. 6 AP-2014]